MNDSAIEPGSGRPGWLDRSFPFLVVDGYQEATALLNEPCMHADFDGLLKAAGASTGVLQGQPSSLLSLNGEEHKRTRAVIANEFTPRASERIRPFAKDVAEDLVSSFTGAGRCEFMEQFASPFVARTTCEYVGFSLDDLAVLSPALDLVARASRDIAEHLDGWHDGMTALAGYSTATLEARRHRPADDLLSRLAAKVDGDLLSQDVAVTLIVTLLTAGLEPTAFQLGLMLIVLSDEEEVWNALWAGQADLPGVVEESLRYRSTNQRAERRVARSFDHDGFTFPEGKRVLIELASSNHDPRRFAAPNRFAPDANKGSHLAFGFGPHYCLGAALARVQLQESLRALTARLSSPTAHEAEFAEGSGLAGPLSLLMTFSGRDSLLGPA